MEGLLISNFPLSVLSLLSLVVRRNLATTRFVRAHRASQRHSLDHPASQPLFDNASQLPWNPLRRAGQVLVSPLPQCPLKEACYGLMLRRLSGLGIAPSSPYKGRLENSTLKSSRYISENPDAQKPVAVSSTSQILVSPPLWAFTVYIHYGREI